MMLAKVANKWVTPTDEEGGDAASIKDFKPREVIKEKRKSMKEKMRGEDGLLRKGANVAKDTVKSTLKDMKSEFKEKGFDGIRGMF